ncbi:MAG: hypothetical protein ABIS50_11335 [Luteolibacter sp.]|uniref:hypothetical protein n=1 Tax=Luteolibacter sp. TaxID=1962973 RepID=UPI0032657A85
MSAAEDYIDSIRLALTGMGFPQVKPTIKLEPYQEAFYEWAQSDSKSAFGFKSRAKGPSWGNYQFELLERITNSLADAGWKFIEKEGPRGFYYEGVRHKKGLARVMGEQHPTKQAAFAAALRQANGIQFPLFH